MATLTDQILAKATGMIPDNNATEPTPAPENAPVAEPAKAPEAAAPETKAPETEKKTEPAPEVKTESFDPNKYLETISSGSIKSEDEIKTLLAEYPTLKQEKADWEKAKAEYEAKLAIDPFADEYEKKRNELKKAGYSKEQLNAFTTLNEIELDKADPKELIKLALMMRDKLSPAEADRKITRQYNLDNDELTEDEKQDFQIDLKLQANKDLEYLQGYKAKVSMVDKSKEQQEAKEAMDKFIAQVEPIAKNIANSYQGFKEFSINGKQGDENMVFNLPVPDEFKAQAPDFIKNYLISNRLPLNDQTIEEAKKLLDGVLWATHGATFVKTAVNHAVAETAKRIEAEYSNPSALSRGKTDAPPPNPDGQYQDFRKNLASGKLKV